MAGDSVHARAQLRLWSFALPALLTVALSLGGATPASAQSRRVPAEWEPQEALWLQWPGRFEQTYVPAFAEISKLVAQHQAVRILHHNVNIRGQARRAIAAGRSSCTEQ